MVSFFFKNREEECIWEDLWLSLIGLTFNSDETRLETLEEELQWIIFPYSIILLMKMGPSNISLLRTTKLWKEEVSTHNVSPKKEYLKDSLWLEPYSNWIRQSTLGAPFTLKMKCAKLSLSSTSSNQISSKIKPKWPLQYRDSTLPGAQSLSSQRLEISRQFS